jgi:catechol 2,3-dioxygenase-like lactoylglutathione lyase family enzyme
MINGAHIVLYTTDAEADRSFFRDVLNFPSVDAGHGWLIFALPPAEAAFHDLDTQSSPTRASPDSDECNFDAAHNPPHRERHDP